MNAISQSKCARGNQTEEEDACLVVETQLAFSNGAALSRAAACEFRSHRNRAQRPKTQSHVHEHRHVDDGATASRLDGGTNQCAADGVGCLPAGTYSSQREDRAKPCAGVCRSKSPSSKRSFHPVDKTRQSVLESRTRELVRAFVLAGSNPETVAGPGLRGI